MKKIIRIALAIFSLLGSTHLFSQNISNKGKEFWVAYGHHHYMEPGQSEGNNTQDMDIYLSAEEAATVTIEIDSSGPIPTNRALWWRRTYIIPANTVISIANSATPASTFTAAALSWGPIPKGTVTGGSNVGTNYDARLFTDPPPAGTGGEGIFKKKGIHITSNVPIVAYSHIYSSVSSGATMLLPVESWGYSYTSINSKQAGASFCYNWMFVIAKENNTEVEITPSATSRLNKSAGVPFRVRLEKGQIYQLIGQADAGGNGVELTGTTVKVVQNSVGQCNPVAVFSGSSRTSNPACGSTGGSRDNDIQQCFPQQTWGKKFLLAPFSESVSTSANTFMTSPYKIVVRDPSTIIRRNGAILTGMLPNNSYYFESDGTEYIEADKPIAIAQFMSSACFNGSGDPEMVYLSPAEQGVKRTSFYRQNKTAITTNYVTLIVPTGGLPSLRIDNSAVFTHTYNHATRPGYSVVVRRWNANPPAQTTIECDSSFTAVTYGLGGAESYGYNAGTYLNNLNAVSDFFNTPDTAKNTVKSHTFGFVGTPMEIGALIAYKPLSIWWKLSTLGGNITPNADVVQTNPIPKDSVQINGIWNYRYRLPGTYTFNSAGTFYIPLQISSTAFGANDCRNLEDVVIEYVIKIKPTITYTYNVGACSSDSIQFNGPAASIEGLNIINWKWTFPNGDTSNLRNPKYRLPTGTHNVKLDVIVAGGGLATVTLQVVVPGSVSVKFGASAYNICIGQTVTFTDTTTGASISNWYWDFGDGKPGAVINASSNANQTYTYTTAGDFVVKHTVTISGASCPVDTIKRTITVSPKAFVDFTTTTGCLPANGLASFTATAPATGVSNYTWTYGDPTSGAANTGSGSNSTHNYTADGTYPIKLAVTTISGCSGDTTKNITFNRLPQITGTIGVVSLICDNTPPISITPPTISNGVTGTALFRSFKGGIADPSTNNYAPSLAGYGIDTIYYKFTTSNSCSDSTKYPITVQARPRGNFTFTPTNTICMPSASDVNFTSNITVPNSSVQTYSWFFESPSVDPAKRSSLANPSYNYPQGTFLTQLSVMGVNGCMFDTLQNFTITKAPAIAPLTQGDVCDNNPPFTITAPTIGGGVSGTGIFKSFKNAITPAGLYTPSAAGVGIDTVYFVFTATGGCVDSVKKAFNVFGRPRGNFSFSPSTGCLNSSGLVNFTNNINVPGSSVASYLWQFESPLNTVSTTSSAANPSYNYNEGIYTIKLSLTGANGCLFDTSQTVTFGKSPSINPIVQSSICENATPITITAPSVTNGVGGSGVWRSYKNAFQNVVTGTYNPSIAGYGVDTLYYTFTTSNNCKDSVKLPLEVFARPRGGFTFSPSGCLDASGNVNFTNNISVVNSTINTYNWKFESPSIAPLNTSTLANPSHIYNPGTYTIDLKATAANGCIFDTTQTVSFGKKPALTPLVQSGVCENITPFNLNTPTVTNGVSGTGVFSSFKNASTAAGLYDPSLAGFGTDTIYYKYTTGIDCYDSVKLPINIAAKARTVIAVNPNSNCLPSNGKVDFSSAATVNGSTIASYGWNFKNPSSAIADTAFTANASYFYTTGSFDIRHTIVTANGCVFDTTFNKSFVLKPSFGSFVIPDVCENNLPFVLSAPSITNGAVGTGVFRSFKNAISTMGVYNPTTAGYGIDTVYYIFTTSAGCLDSTKAQINVKARPRAGFVINPPGCLNAAGTASFTSNVSVPNSIISGYSWQFESPLGTPSTTSVVPNPTYNYASDGTYTIKLTILAANGCVFDTSETRGISKQPAINPIVVPTGVCENGVTQTISAPSITNGASGNGSFRSLKNAISSTGIYDPSIAGYGVDTIYYTFITGGGCRDSVKSPITILARPRATFTISPSSSCLNATGTATFTSTASVPNSSVSNYAWQFESPLNTPSTTSNLANPVHNYATDGTYTIKLTVTGANGCVFDTLQTSTFSKQPAISQIVVPTGVCENGATQTILAPSITNGASGSGSFRSLKNAISPTGAYNPSIAGYGVDTIYYTFITGGGCRDSVKSPITILARPRATFTISPSSSCLNATGTATFTSTASVPNSSVSNYAWQFESPLNTPATTSNLANPVHNYATDGTYTIKLTVTGANGCVFDTLQTSTFSKQPAISPIVVPTGVCENGVTQTISAPSITNGAFGNGSFRSLKNAISSTGIYDPSIAGYGVDTIYYTFITGGGCRDSVKPPITIQARPRATFTVSPLGCLDVAGTANFTSSVSVPNSSVNTYLWQFESPLNTPSTTSNLANPIYNYIHGANHTIKLTVTGANNCSFDTSLTRTFNRTPDLPSLTVSSVCENAPAFQIIERLPINGVNGTGVFTSFKNAITPTGNYDPSISKAGIDTIYYTFTSTSGGCVSSVKTPITISARPRATFAISPTGCLDVLGTASFTSNVTVPGSSISGYSWQFESPSTTAATTSTLPNPMYNYSSDGSYTIKLTVTGANGCTFDTSQVRAITRIPQLAPIVVAGRCENADTFRVPGAVVLNSVSGSGVFTSFKNAIVNSTTGLYNPAIAGFGEDTVYYTFTSLGGCSSTVKTLIQLQEKPVSTIFTSPNLCLDSTLNILSSTLISTGSIASWNWSLGNGTNPVFTNGNPFTANYSSLGEKTISLVTISNAGCKSDTAKQIINVRPMPVPDFTIPISVCMPNGIASFTNTSTISPTGSMSYLWNFGDVAGSTPSNPNVSTLVNGSHIYPSISAYTVTLTATSIYGCQKTDTAIINTFLAKPNAYAKTLLDTLCQGTSSVFIDSSWSVGSAILGWRWDMGDGTIRTNQNPVHTYRNPGNYTVKLVVRNLAGCVSDTFPKNVLVYLQPSVNAGPSFVLKQGEGAQFMPTANDSLTTRFAWSPPVFLNKADTLRPYYQSASISPSSTTTSTTYWLTATGLGGCVARDSLTVKILGALIIPNVFSPNSDGINDVWDIPNLRDYPGATVQIFNRYGQQVYTSTGYSKPWDGKFLGNPLPIGTYYYIINPRNGLQTISGGVTILR